MIWSRSASPRVSAALFNRVVISRSSGLGSSRPEGWLCATTTAQALSVRGSAKTSRGCTTVLFTRPTETIRAAMSSCAPLSEQHTKRSCFRSAQCETIGQMSRGEATRVSREPYTRRPSSKAAATAQALASPMPLMLRSRAGSGTEREESSRPRTSSARASRLCLACPYR